MGTQSCIIFENFLKGANVIQAVILTLSRIMQVVLSQLETCMPRHSTVWGEVKFLMLLKLKLFPATSYLVCKHSSRRQITTPLNEGKSPQEKTNRPLIGPFSLNLPCFLFLNIFLCSLKILCCSCPPLNKKLLITTTPHNTTPCSKACWPLKHIQIP